MKNNTILTRLEYNLLSMTVDDDEPLFILYADTKRDIEGATLDLILKALIKLLNMGLIECIIKPGDKWQKCKPSLSDLKKRFEDQTEKEKLEYPMHMDEYYFKITNKGRLEEAKDIYDKYHPLF